MHMTIQKQKLPHFDLALKAERKNSYAANSNLNQKKIYKDSQKELVVDFKENENLSLDFMNHFNFISKRGTVV